MLRALMATPLFSCRRARLTTLSSTSSASSRHLNPNTLFIKGKRSNTAITAALKEHHQNLSFPEIANFLFVSSRNGFSLSPAQLHFVRSAVRNRNGQINPISISKFFHGLKLQSSKSQPVLDVLCEVYPLLTCPNSQLKPFHSHEIGAMMQGNFIQ